MCIVKILCNGLGFNGLKQKYIFLPTEKIKAIEINIELTEEEKEKSVICRAIIGGLLLGSTGAIIGGMSGIGTEQ